MKIIIDRRTILRGGLATAAIACAPALSSCAAPVVGAGAEPVVWPLVLEFAKQLGLTVAAEGVVAIAKKGYRELKDDFGRFKDEDGTQRRQKRGTACRHGEGSQTLIPVAFEAAPVHNTRVSSLVSLVSVDGHRIDLLPRAAQALSGVALQLSASLRPNDIAHLLLPVSGSRSAGGSPAHWRSVRWMTEEGWVTIEHRPRQGLEVVSVIGSKTGSWGFQLSRGGHSLSAA